jgi:hypothetical protein
LTYAEMVLGLCERFHVLPSQVEAEDVGLLRMLTIRDLGTPGQDGPGTDPYPG